MARPKLLADVDRAEQIFRPLLGAYEAGIYPYHNGYRDPMMKMVGHLRLTHADLTSEELVRICWLATQLDRTVISERLAQVIAHELTDRAKFRYFDPAYITAQDRIDKVYEWMRRDLGYALAPTYLPYLVHNAFRLRRVYDGQIMRIFDDEPDLMSVMREKLIRPRRKVKPTFGSEYYKRTKRLKNPEKAIYRIIKEIGQDPRFDYFLGWGQKTTRLFLARLVDAGVIDRANVHTLGVAVDFHIIRISVGTSIVRTADEETDSGSGIGLVHNCGRETVSRVLYPMFQELCVNRGFDPINLSHALWRWGNAVCGQKRCFVIPELNYQPCPLFRKAICRFRLSAYPYYDSGTIWVSDHRTYGHAANTMDTIERTLDLDFDDPDSPYEHGHYLLEESSP